MSEPHLAFRIGEQVELKPKIDSFWEYGGYIAKVTHVIRHKEGDYILSTSTEV